MFHLSQSQKFSFTLSLVLSLLSVVWWGLAHASPVYAATLPVTNTNDSGAGSLRQALVDAQAGDTIVFSLSPNAIITVTSELTVTQFITIDGTTVVNLSVSGGGTTRVFNVSTPAMFSGFTVMNGNVSGDGGGLYSTSALTLTAMQFLSNTAAFGGGGVRVVGAAKVNGGLFQNNVSTGSDGGGLYADSTLALTGTQFINNVADFGGGGLYLGNGANPASRVVNALFAQYRHQHAGRGLVSELDGQRADSAHDHH